MKGSRFYVGEAPWPNESCSEIISPFVSIVLPSRSALIEKQAHEHIRHEVIQYRSKRDTRISVRIRGCGRRCTLACSRRTPSARGGLLSPATPMRGLYSTVRRSAYYCNAAGPRSRASRGLMRLASHGRNERCTYSPLNTADGFTDAARRAGSVAAINALANNVITAVAKTPTSKPATPYN